MRAIDLFAGAGAADERWAPIAGFPGYEISDQGRARSVRTGKTLAISVPKNGYALLHLRNAEGRKALLVHRLVLLAFKGPCPSGWEGSHQDGNRANNRLTNLEWETTVDNRARKKGHGTARTGSGHPQAILSEEAVSQMRKLYAAGGVSLKALAAQFGVSPSVAGSAVRGTTWKDADRVQFRPPVAGEVPCACGCGRGILPTDSKGRQRRYIHGHNAVVPPVARDVINAIRDAA